MAQGGLFDPLGGGVHAASVDERWVVPLFEKRAADQAAALDGLGWAVDALADVRLRQLRTAVARFCGESLRLDGGFCAGLDADSGPYDHAAYYTFSEAEARQALPAELFAVGQRAFDLYGRGELPSNPTRNVLYRAQAPSALATELKLSVDEVERQLVGVREALRMAQQRRAQPPRDEAMPLDANAALARALLPIDPAVAMRALDGVYAACEAAGDGALRHRGESLATTDWLPDVVAIGRAALAAHAHTGEPHHLARAVQMHRRLARFSLGGGAYGAVSGDGKRWSLPYVAAPLIDGTRPSAIAECARFCAELAPHRQTPAAADAKRLDRRARGATPPRWASKGVGSWRLCQRTT